MITTSRLSEIDNVGSTIDYKINGSTIELESEFYIVFMVIKKNIVYLFIFILFFPYLENIKINQNFFSYLWK